MALLDSSGNDICTEWLAIGLVDASSSDIPPFEDCGAGVYSIACGGHPKPSTPYYEYNRQIPWNYSTSNFLNDNCTHPSHDYYKALYDYGEYIMYAPASVCDSTTPPTDTQQYIQDIIYYPGDLGNGFQMRTKATSHKLINVEWDDYYDCMRYEYTTIITYKFSYWIMEADTGTQPPPPPGWEWTPDRALVQIEHDILTNDDITIPIDTTYPGSNGDTILDDYTSCCDFVPKDFIAWADGWNLNQLVPPNKR